MTNYGYYSLFVTIFGEAMDETQQQTTHIRPRSWLDQYLDYTKGLYTSTKFNLAMGLIALSAATHGRVYLKRGHLTLYPHLWCLLVAPPGSGKGNSITVMQELVRDANVNSFLGTLTTASIFDALVDSKISCNDRDLGTIERMPLLITAAEASSFFQADEHRKGIIGQLTDLYDQPHNPRYEKKLADRLRNIVLVRPYLTFAGAATGDSLLDAIPAWAIEHGFMSRLLAIWSDYPTPVPPRTDAARMAAERKQLADHLRFIRENDKYFSGAFQWRRDALDYYNGRELAERRRLLTMDTKLRAYRSRRGTFLLKIAMLVSLARRD